MTEKIILEMYDCKKTDFSIGDAARTISGLETFKQTKAGATASNPNYEMRLTLHQGYARAEFIPLQERLHPYDTINKLIETFKPSRRKIC